VSLRLPTPRPHPATAAEIALARPEAERQVNEFHRQYTGLAHWQTKVLFVEQRIVCMLASGMCRREGEGLVFWRARPPYGWSEWDEAYEAYYDRLLRNADAPYHSDPVSLN